MMSLEFWLIIMKKVCLIAKELSKEISIVIYKKGEKGSTTFYDNKQIDKGIFPVNALKPTGAGDAFHGIFYWRTNK